MSDRVAREKAIEDVLATHPDVTEVVLDYDSGSLTLLNQQHSTEVGITDLLFLAGNELVLIELKTESATEEHVDQLQRYRDHYETELLGDEFPTASALSPILLAPEIPKTIRNDCQNRGLDAIEFDVNSVLTQFENRIFTGHRMFDQKPVSTGVGELHYINGLIRYLGESTDPKTRGDCIDDLPDIAKQPDWNKPKSRMGQFLRLGIRLNLIYQVGSGQSSNTTRQVRVTEDDKHLLTERGVNYFEALKDTSEQVPRLTVDQADVIIELLYNQPFYSKVTTGMVVLLDTVYDLSRSSDRVSDEELERWYPRKAGKQWEGKSPASLVNWYGNYLAELGLLTEVPTNTDITHFHLTPDGVQLLSHLHIDIGKELIKSQP